MLKGAERLELQVPERRAPDAYAFDTSPKRVKAWVASLPMADTGETARALFESIKEVNELAISPSARFKFLELIRSSVHQVDRALESYYMGKSFPLSKRNRQIANLAREFQIQVATGYKAVVKDLAGESGLPVILHRPMLIASLHRSIRYLSRVLVRSYQLYSPYPETVWREIHQLYSFAARNRLQNNGVQDEEGLLVKRHSVADAYKQILLLAVCSPYRLRQGDVIKAYAALEKWAPYCGLAPVNTRQQTWYGLFGVPADIDDQPNYLDIKKGATGRLDWVLDTAALGDLLRQQRDAMSRAGQSNELAISKEIPPDMSPELLERLMQSWRMMRKRGYSRISKREDEFVEVALGLSAVHYFARGRRHTGPEADDGGIEVEEVEETELVGDRLVSWAATASQNPKHETLRCNVEDEGVGGYRLRWKGENQGKAQMGELLGMRRTALGHREYWAVGVIRWMRGIEETDLEVGVQMLAPDAQAVQVSVSNAEGKVGEALPSLVLPPVEAINRPRTLVAPLFLTHFPDKVHLTMDDTETVICLTRVVESTDSFAQFEFEPYQPGQAEDTLERRSKDKAQDEEGDQSELDSLWSSL